MAGNPNDPFSDPLRPGRQAAKQAQDTFQDSIKRGDAIRAGMTKITGDAIKRNADILADNKRRNEFTSHLLGNRGSSGSSSSVGGAALVLLIPIGFLVVLGLIAVMAWKLLT